MAASPLGDRDVHVWEASPEALADEPANRLCLALLSPEERARHDRFVFARDRQVFLVAHALLRSILARYLDEAPTALEFEEGPHGRPEVRVAGRSRPLRFSLSHTTGHVACALTARADCGIDVEDMERHGPSVDGDVAATFAPSEVQGLSALPPGARRERFFALWTLKESVLKASGEGLSRPLDSFALDVDTAEGDVLRARGGLGEGEWRFWRWRPSARHRAALAVRTAVRGPALELERKTWGGPSAS